MTVSLALRGSREVSAVTRRRLCRLAASSGYLPDPTITKLMHHLRARAPQRYKASIGGLMPLWPNAIGNRNDYLTRLSSSLRTRAQSLGYGFDLIMSDEHPTRRQLERVMLTRGIEGVVILPLRQPGELDERLSWDRFSVVSTASSLLSPGFNSVMPHHFENMLRACRALTAAGYRRIGLSISRHWNDCVNHRWTGALAWQNQFGGTEPVIPLFRDDSGEERDAAAFSAWLERERPDAVISERIEPSLVKATIQRLPQNRQPFLVTMNLPSAATNIGIDQCPEQIGTIAVELLAGMIVRGERGIPATPHTTLVNGRWIGPGSPSTMTNRELIVGPQPKKSAPCAKRSAAASVAKP
jgi:LacI family transcriptional regulator